MLYFKFSESQEKYGVNTIKDNGIKYTEMATNKIPDHWDKKEIVFQTDKKTVQIIVPNGKVYWTQIIEDIEKQFFNEVAEIKTESLSKEEVDFDMLKNMLRPVGTTSLTKKIFCDPSQDELANLSLFLKLLSNKKFAILASHKLR